MSTPAEARARLRAAEHAYNKANPGRDLTAAREELTSAREEYAQACIRFVEDMEVEDGSK